MKLYAKVLAAWLLFAGSLFGQGVVAIDRTQAKNANNLIFRPGTHNLTSVLTLTTDKPSLLGFGRERTKLTFPTTLTGRAISNENYGSSDGRWRAAWVEIDGQETPGAAGNCGQGAAASVAYALNGIDLQGNGSEHVTDVYVHAFQGTGVKVTRQAMVSNLEVAHCLTGIHVTSSDTQLIGPGYIRGHRDYCGHIDSGGNVTSVGIHWFGAGFGDEASHGANESSALFLDGTQYFRSTNDTYADAPNGIYCGGQNSVITNALIQHCTRRGLLVTGGENHFVGCNIFGQLRTNEWTDAIAVEFQGERNVIEGGQIQLSNYKHPGNTGGAASVGLLLSDTDAKSCVAKGVRLIDADGLNGTVGVKVSAPVLGGEYEFDVYGFNQSSDRLLVVDAAALTGTNADGTKGMRGVRFRFNLMTTQTHDVTNPGTESAGISKYVDIPDVANPDDWHTSNEVIIYDERTKTTVTLTPGTAY